MANDRAMMTMMRKYEGISLGKTDADMTKFHRTPIARIVKLSRRA
jgi:hypothetical protein